MLSQLDQYDRQRRGGVALLENVIPVLPSGLVSFNAGRYSLYYI